MFSLLFLFTGVFTFRDDLLGKTFVETPEPAAALVGANEVEKMAEAEEAPAFELPADLIAEALRNPRRVKPLPLEVIDAETLWLARCIFSETKRAEEQELVAWVVRNRVETRYRSKRTYRDVVLDDYQFSAFNPGTRTRLFYSKLGTGSRTPGWKNALFLAHYVRHADPSLRPFPKKTRHFYSERSMVDELSPEWAEGLHPVTPERPHQIDARRFRFYEGVY